MHGYTILSQTHTLQKGWKRNETSCQEKLPLDGKTTDNYYFLLYSFYELPKFPVIYNQKNIFDTTNLFLFVVLWIWSA